MAVIEINRNPSRRELAWFGWLLPIFTALLGLLTWWRASLDAASWIWWIGGALSAVVFLVPPLRRPIYVGWMLAVFPIGWVISHTVLAAIYYLVFTPIGLLMKLVGYDPMHRRREPEAKTYWVERAPTAGVGRYFRQF